MHELAGKPTQHPTNSPCIASYKDAASLLFLDPGLVSVLLSNLAHALFFFVIRVYLLLLFFEGSKGDELHDEQYRATPGAGAHV